MAWDWAGPLATTTVGSVGIFFTWLTGERARQHAERLTAQASESERRHRVEKERRDVYLAALEFCELEIYRERYTEEKAVDKLERLEALFPKGERTTRGAEIRARLFTFGSENAIALAEEWRVAVNPPELSRMQTAFDKMKALARAELGGGDLPAGHPTPREVASGLS